MAKRRTTTVVVKSGGTKTRRAQNRKRYAIMHKVLAAEDVKSSWKRTADRRELKQYRIDTGGRHRGVMTIGQRLKAMTKQGYIRW